MEPTQKIHHHYLPQCYLRLFSENDSGIVEQLILSTNKSIKAHVKVLAVEKYLYSIETPATKNDSRIEDFFSEIEGNAATAFSNCIKHPHLLNDENKEWILQFMTFQYLRTPSRISHINELLKKFHYNRVETMANDDNFMKAIMKKEGKSDEEIESLRNYMKKGKEAFDIVIHQNEKIAGMIKVYNDLFPIFYSMHWKLLEAKGDMFFVTCDNPISTTEITPFLTRILTGAFLNNNIEIAFPLSRKFCIIGTRNGHDWFKHTLAGKYAVNQINLRTIACAKEFVFAPYISKDIIELIEYKKANKRPL